MHILVTYHTYMSIKMDLDGVLMKATSIWVFGYGSLTWKPDFSFSRKEIGYIRGYKRRFWQGNETHRGTKERIGRVATLIPARKGKVWGVAFEIKGKEAISKALGGLTTREITLGGYDVKMTSFYQRDQWTEPRSALVFMATDQNDLFLGKADIDTLALEVVLARGTAGTNTEYVTRLADYIRKHIPEEHDKHLFDLDNKVRELERLEYNNCLNDFIINSELYQSKPDVINANDVDDKETDVTTNVQSPRAWSDASIENGLHSLSTTLHPSIYKLAFKTESLPRMFN